jgi:hypothetical protein
VAQASRRALVSVLFRGVVRRHSTGYPAPIHRAAAGPALNLKFPAYPGLNFGACAGALVNSQVPVYRLHIELKYLKPAVWKRVLLPASIKLPKLHVVLLCAKGWDCGHLHEFVFADTSSQTPDPDFPPDPPILNEARGSLGKALGTLKVFTYISDYGGNWQHRVKGEKVLPHDPELRSPIWLDGRNVCPSEDVGDLPGYLQFLDTIIDPAHEEHHRLLDRCSGSFDPAAFDLQGFKRTPLRDQILTVKPATKCRLRISRATSGSSGSVKRQWSGERGAGRQVSR